MSSKYSLVFSVTWQSPALIAPATPTPREIKQLSDIDDQDSLRFHAPLIFFYKNNNTSSSTSVVKEKDPVRVIKEAISKALVFYYPFAGRLVEGPNRKLMVDCNGEGILFIEADANFTLEELGDQILSPCPYLDQLLHNVPGSDGMLGCPLFLIQVTRLKCGGFVIALRFNHTMCDAIGLIQFLRTIEEMAQGSNTPSLFPVWHRELLSSKNPPQVTSVPNEHEQISTIPDAFRTTNPNEMSQKSFYFGSKEISLIKNQLPSHLRNCSTFDLLAAFMWRCRTIALELDPEDTVQFSWLVTARGKHYNMNLPSGYYGNALAIPAVWSKAGTLCKSPLGYVVEMVKKAKDKMSEEYKRSVGLGDELVLIKGQRVKYPSKGNFMVTDLSKVGFDEIDLGWGKPVFAGIAGAISMLSVFAKYRKEDEGESGILIPIRLPVSNMRRFEEELKRLMIQGSMEDLFYIKGTQISCKL